MTSLIKFLAKVEFFAPLATKENPHDHTCNHRQFPHESNPQSQVEEEPDYVLLKIQEGLRTYGITDTETTADSEPPSDTEPDTSLFNLAFAYAYNRFTRSHRRAKGRAVADFTTVNTCLSKDAFTQTEDSCTRRNFVNCLW
jgi:hypothetical protein